ncbi:MAG: lipase [Hahellaceae bacterium]|jgi:triacylglycerol lipase|nr:lipase [Hahellaceae bacterium]
MTIKTTGRKALNTTLLTLALAAPLSAMAEISTPQAPAERANDYPIALVHGFFGWGREEVFGWHHFGGFNDLQEILKSRGYHTVTPAVGPISSDWDRAAELYAQLVGGQVDYGAAHAREHQHARFGRTYAQPLIPGLGQTTDGKRQKVNLIAHSQGSPTVRVLIELLANGSGAEQAETAPQDLSPLFQGGNQWVHSVAAISGANDGSLLAHTIYHNISFENELLTGITKLVNVLGLDSVYDFKLDQFGLGPRQKGESFNAYMKRAMSVMLDKDNRDTAFYDLSADGAEAVNAFASAESDVYYFSWANETTTKGFLTGIHYPQLQTNILLSPFTLFMGAYNPKLAPGNVPISNEWRENDGITSTRSMSAPINGSTDLMVNYNAYQPVNPGVWNYMGKISGYDHWDMIGLLDANHSASKNIIPFYLNVAQFLASTPAEN